MPEENKDVHQDNENPNPNEMEKRSDENQTVSHATPKTSSTLPMNNLKKALSSKGALIIVLVALIVSLLYYYKGAFIVAKVNGDFITRIALIQELEKNYGSDTLDNMVKEKIIEQEIARSGVVVSEDAINTEVETIKSTLSGQGQTLEEYLQFQGLDEQGLRKNIRLRLAVEEILADKISVSDDEIDAYIEQNKDSFDENTDTSSAEVRDLIRDEIKSQKFSTEAQTWLDDLESNANTSYFITF